MFALKSLFPEVACLLIVNVHANPSDASSASQSPFDGVSLFRRRRLAPLQEHSDTTPFPDAPCHHTSPSYGSAADIIPDPVFCTAAYDGFYTCIYVEWGPDISVHDNGSIVVSSRQLQASQLLRRQWRLTNMHRGGQPNVWGAWGPLKEGVSHLEISPNCEALYLQSNIWGCD
jgi:hypothetical protein